jgi:hypothetical protein
MSKDVLFARLLGIRRESKGGLMQLPLTDQVQNHLGSMHASAQFALAEVSSGDFLRRHFPSLQGQVVAVVRRAEIKYSKQVSSTLVAFPYIEKADEEKLHKQLHSSRRALLAVHVKLKTQSGEVATHAVYHWFITKL